MSQLEQLTPNSALRGILPDGLVTVVSVQWFGSEALELTYKAPTERSQTNSSTVTTRPVVQELDKRVRADVRKTGDFPCVHALPQSGQDVPDDMDARSVVLGIDHPYSKDPDNAAEAAARAIFDSRGNAPRLFSNTLVFLALDKVRLQDLDEAIRGYLVGNLS